jgi:predicted Ser/Thr protein kinase
VPKGWIVERQLGHGAYGRVYRARHPLIPETCLALKVLPTAHWGENGRRFAREVEALHRLCHSAVVGVRFWGREEDRGLLYIAMEYLEGRSLQGLFAKTRLDQFEAVGLLAPVARGLAHAHRKGVYHRDIKPSNVIQCNDGRVVIIDFGLAIEHEAQRITGNGALGTPEYMCPELLEYGCADFQQIDVYGFGVVLYEALSGDSQFHRRRHDDVRLWLHDLLDFKFKGPMDPGPGVLGVLRDLVKRATHPDPSKRLKSMEPIAECLSTLAGTQVARRPSLSGSHGIRTETAEVLEERSNRGPGLGARHDRVEDCPTDAHALTAPGEVGVARLFMEHPDRGVEAVELGDHILKIGRAAGNDVVLDGDPRVSREHCVVYRAGPSYLLFDSDSKNGTSVGGRRVQVHELVEGDIFQVGDTLFMFSFVTERQTPTLRWYDKTLQSVRALLERRSRPQGTTESDP